MPHRPHRSLPGIGATLVFEASKGARAETDYALGKAALLVLSRSGPTGRHFPELLECATAALSEAAVPANTPQAEKADDLASFLLQLYAAGLVDFRSTRPPGARAVSTHPVVSALARRQSARGDCVTSLFHQTVRLEDRIGVQLLGLVDGTRDHAAIIDALLEFVSSQRAAEGPSAAPGEPNLREEIGLELEANLAKLLRLGLLLA